MLAERYIDLRNAMMISKQPLRFLPVLSTNCANSWAALVIALFGIASSPYCVSQESSPAWSQLAPYFTPPADLREADANYASPLKFYDGRTVERADQWPERRAEILAAWHKLMGRWPALLQKPIVTWLEREHRHNFTQHHVLVQIADGDETSEGFLLVPDGDGPFPAVLVPFYDGRTSVGL